VKERVGRKRERKRDIGERQTDRHIDAETFKRQRGRHRQRQRQTVMRRKLSYLDRA